MVRDWSHVLDATLGEASGHEADNYDGAELEAIVDGKTLGAGDTT